MLHLPVAQSRSLRQPWAIEHRFSQVVPPQSTPVSVPSFTWLTQEVHVSASHCPLAQSVATRHSFASAQGSQSLPPQLAPPDALGYTA